MTRIPWCIASAAALTFLIGCAAYAQTIPAPADEVAPTFRIQVWGDTVTDFTTRLQGYFELRARLERRLPAIVVSDDPDQVARGQHSLAHAIRGARRGAVTGEFFTLATGAAFRLVLVGVMNADVWAVIMDDNPGAFAHDVDGTYPGGKPFSTMPGVVLARLPRLPDGVEFRFLGRHLILYDARANTIIDQLSFAIEFPDRDD